MSDDQLEPQDDLLPQDEAKFEDFVGSHRRRISPLRVVLALLVVGLGATALYNIDQNREIVASADAPRAWVAPYVDATVTPLFPFEQAHDEVTDITLAFVVSDQTDPCTPAWAGLFDVESAADHLDLDRRIARLRQTGRDVLVSFGGAAGSELAVSCTDVEALADAYLSIVEYYDITTIDLDIEGPALGNVEATARRAEAIAMVQNTRLEEESPLAVWLTLPATPSGLTSDGTGVVDAMLVSEVNLSGVNLMTMNFGASRESASMFEATRTALEGATNQLMTAWQRAGIPMTTLDARRRVGATPMIGRNDTVTDIFTLDHAESLTDLVMSQGYGRVSYWSLNRDLPCSANDAPIASPSNHCSHEDQEAREYAAAFQALDGRAGTAVGHKFESEELALVADNPELSPYPIWRTGKAYEVGQKIVWQGYVYQAKWWTTDNNPETLVENEWDTPWRLVGPVLLDDLREPVRVPAGLVDSWDGEETYDQGDQVWLDGQVYEAKWWTQGFQPNREVERDAETPWVELDPELFVSDF